MMKEDRRKYKRVAVDFPVVFKISRRSVLGKAVNACNEGMMVESNLPLETAVKILKTLAKKRDHRLDVRFTHNKKPYRPEAEIRHFHLDLFGNGMCRSVAGFFMPTIR